MRSLQDFAHTLFLLHKNTPFITVAVALMLMFVLLVTG